MSEAQEVLVVDDNPVTRYATARVLQAAGFLTREAGTGNEALERASGELSAVILDVHLPDINGFEVCRLLRERPDTARLPVIHLSAAYVRDDDKVRGLHSGADAYMTHPADPALLVATIQVLARARKAEEGMRRSEARFRAIYDGAQSAICLVDRDGRFIEANPALLRRLDRRACDVVGREVADFAPAEWRERIGGYLAESRNGTWRGDFPLLDAQGRTVHFEWNVSAHVEPDVSFAIATDISERVALAVQREHLLEREQAARASAERVNRSKDEFIAVLSHELRTPLNAILTWVHVLKRGGAAVDLSRGLDAIERNAKTQTRLISDILDMSRMDSGKLRLNLEPTDAAELVQYAAAALSGTWRDKKLDVIVDTEGVVEPMLIDPARMQQIVWNLLTNAIKFSQPGQTVRVDLRAEDDNLVLSVQDEGQGIKPEFLPQLFERFTQSDSASNRYHGGLGLGLSIVKHLVELHGGSIEVDSAGPGQGARFTVTMPAHGPGPDHQAPAASVQDSAPPADNASLQGVSLLVVEDDAEAGEMLGIILRDQGAQVRLAADANAALRALDESQPDLLVSDVGLPGRDGHDLVRELRRREQGRGRHLPAIALTAFAREQDRVLALEAGFDDHCAKPLKPNVLVAAIQRLLAREAPGAPSA